MASRQKSFFDQSIIQAPYRKGYHRNKHATEKLGHNQALDNASKQPVIAASFSAKTKLAAFQLDMPLLTDSQEAEGKENVECSPGKSPRRKKDVLSEDNGAKLSTHVPPSTPAVRIPLADLLGNNEDTRRPMQSKENSPELKWVTSSQHPDFSPRKRRKRAHSSSPVTSSQNSTSEHFNLKAPPRLAEIQHALETPKTDPAADLWTRYNGSNKMAEPVEHRLPSLAHLLRESSPQSLPRTPGGSVSGLRRWASCGNEWPASKSKRRKITRAGDQDKTRSMTTSESSRGSKLSAMVGRMQQSLHEPISRPTLHLKEPSSSSPLPDRGSFEDIGDGSPIRQACGRVVARQRLESVAERKMALGGSDDSDYGDDGIDLADLVVDEQVVESQQNVGDLAPHQEDSGYHEPLGASKASKDEIAESQLLLPTIEEDSDEFGGDDDLTAEDLETAFSQIDSLATQHQALHKAQNTTYTQQQYSSNRDLCAVTAADDDDEFGDLDADEESFAAAEIAATQAYRACAKSQTSTITPRIRKIQRYLVQKVVPGTFVDQRGFLQQEKILLVEEDRARTAKTITLRQSWLDTRCSPGAYVHVVGDFSKTGHITIDDAANLIIVHPDHLVSATAVADSFDCLRKSVLQDRIKATSITSKPTVYGSILHELFQTALRHNRWDLGWLQRLVDELVVKYIEGLFEAGARDTVEAVEFLSSKLPELHDWADNFVRSDPSMITKAQDRNGKTTALSVTKLLDVEEHVWSPTYGLKGNIDATVEAVMEDESGRRRLTVPFEVKTGKYQSAAHRAQTALYTLLLSDRYDVDVQYGILYYMDNSATHRIPAIRHELRHMVMQRNELASYVRERLSLPPMLKNEFKCGKCYAKTSCFLYHKLAEDGTPESAGVGLKFGQVVSKLRPSHQEFFKKWDDLLTKEETEMFKFRRELWTMLSLEREKLGRCFSEVVIERGSGHEDRDAQKINRFSNTFVRKQPKPGASFNDSQIAVGEPIVISSEAGHFALASGYVTKISTTRISVAVDRRLHNARTRQPGFREADNQSFAGIMEVGTEDAKITASMAKDEGQVVYRLDKDEFSNGMATVRNNLLAIMNEEVFRSYELRELIIENKPPVFKPTPTAYTLSGPASKMQINQDQRAAIDKIMSAQDYALVLGMPGTGKTTTIAHIICALVARGKSVLLTSYTHTAVDNILLKLRGRSVSVLRLGIQSKIHPEVQEFARLGCMPPQTISELEDMYMSPSVVATTCLGVKHQLFHKRIFDYCIVDEASQITLPVCLGPIRMARTFVLVGDHYQLPPLVQNKAAQEGGLDVSLFKLLSDRRPESVVNLEHQYRMASDIMHLSNTLVYDGHLKCGNEAVADRTLEVPTPTALETFHASHGGPTHSTPCGPDPRRCLLADILCARRKAVFANTDNVSQAHECVSGPRITNPYEVSVVQLLTHGLLAQGIPPSQIGVITFYRSQLSILRQAFKGTPAESIEMHTADKFQGRDKEVVLLSCVRSNRDGNVGELLRDWRRANVAITRARSKFVIVGSRRTLEGDDLWKKLVALIQERSCVVDLESAFLEKHAVCGTGGLEFQQHSAGSPERRTPLGERKDVGNQARKPIKHGRIGKDLLLKGKPVIQDIWADVLA